jgi:acetate kinase
MDNVILAVNGGSSSVKSALFTWGPSPSVLGRTVIEGTGAAAVPEIIRWVAMQVQPREITGIGHRIVHGGPTHGEPQPITAAVLKDLAGVIPFAPNHLPAEIALVNALQRHAPDVPQVACFDTSFHSTMPEVARRLPIPSEYDARGVRRYGFHGLSYAYLIEELRRIAGVDVATGRVILAHLGNGSSLAAVRHGHSIDTTMAFTPMGGVVMSTRSGDIDPGVLTYLGRTEGLSPDQIEELLSQRSGLLGISQTSGNMQALLEREGSDGHARLAVESYVYSIGKAIGALAAALHGLDTLVFAGGIGEHAGRVRARICEGLAFLGIRLDETANAANAAVISASDSRVHVRVIPTNEELMIARATYRVLASR